MANQRLSKLQRAILEELDNMYGRCDKRIPYTIPVELPEGGVFNIPGNSNTGIIDFKIAVAKRLGINVNIKHRKPGHVFGVHLREKDIIHYENTGFNQSFSRSIRNLDSKDLIRCYCDGYKDRVVTIVLTDKGKSLMFRVQNRERS